MGVTGAEIWSLDPVPLGPPLSSASQPPPALGRMQEISGLCPEPQNSAPITESGLLQNSVPQSQKRAPSPSFSPTWSIPSSNFFSVSYPKHKQPDKIPLNSANANCGLKMEIAK